MRGEKGVSVKGAKGGEECKKEAKSEGKREGRWRVRGMEHEGGKRGASLIGGEREEKHRRKDKGWREAGGKGVREARSREVTSLSGT